MSTPAAEPSRDDVAEADWAEQQVAADPEADEVLSQGQRPPRSVITEADPADLAEQELDAYVTDDEV